jgi:hypothetical protein
MQLKGSVCSRLIHDRHQSRCMLPKNDILVDYLFLGRKLVAAGSWIPKRQPRKVEKRDAYSQTNALPSNTKYSEYFIRLFLIRIDKPRVRRKIANMFYHRIEDRIAARANIARSTVTPFLVQSLLQITLTLDITISLSALHNSLDGGPHDHTIYLSPVVVISSLKHGTAHQANNLTLPLSPPPHQISPSPRPFLAKLSSPA